MFASNEASLRKLVAIAVISAIAAQPVELAYAANHPFSSVKDVNIINLTANVDWDYDGPPPMQLGNGGVALTKEVIETRILREAARSIYLMTEGKHRVGNVYVYKNSHYGNNVDIVLINKSGRSNASVAKWQVTGGNSSDYLSSERMDPKTNKLNVEPEGLESVGRVIAHEMGHYIYGVLDEYAEADKSSSIFIGMNDSDKASFPQFGDNVRSTIMNDHDMFSRFSIADDYPSAGVNQTAQARIYGDKATGYSSGSQWEMLVRDPKLDGVLAKAMHEGNRKLFEAFKGLVAPKSLTDLSKFYGVYCPPPPELQVAGCLDSAATTQGTPIGWRIKTGPAFWAKVWTASGGSTSADAVDGGKAGAFEDFKVVWVDSPSNAAVSRDAILIDRTLPQAAFNAAIATAIDQVNTNSINVQLAIVASPADTALTLVPLKPVASNKQEMISALRSLKRANGTFDLAGSYKEIDRILNQGRGVADSSSIYLMTDGTRDMNVPESLSKDARASKNAIFVVKFDGPAFGARSETGSATIKQLEKLARASGGELFAAHSAQEAIQKISTQTLAALASRTSTLASASYKPSTGKHTESTEFKVSTSDETIRAEWRFEANDKSKVGFQLVSPTGFAYPADELDLDNGYAAITLVNNYNSRTGTWRAETAYSGKTLEAVELAILTDSIVDLDVAMSGGEKSETGLPVLRATLAGYQPIIRANVLANIYRADDGVLMLSNLELKDDGNGADGKANDGSYTVELIDLLPAGEYFVRFFTETTANSVFYSNRPKAMGEQAAVATPVGPVLQRVRDMNFSLEEGAPGVARAGGCTVSNGPADLGLIGLLLSALIGLGVRRRKNPQSD